MMLTEEVEDFSIQNDTFSIQNDTFSIQNDAFSSGNIVHRPDHRAAWVPAAARCGRCAGYGATDVNAAETRRRRRRRRQQREVSYIEKWTISYIETVGLTAPRRPGSRRRRLNLRIRSAGRFVAIASPRMS